MSRSTRSPPASGGWSGEEGPQTILPYSYLGTEGVLDGLNVGDAFFQSINPVECCGRNP